MVTTLNTIFERILKFGTDDPMGAVMVLTVVVTGCAALLKRRPSVKQIGKNCWAGLSDLRRAGLLKGYGLVIGRFGCRILTVSKPEHVAVIGTTGAGKTVGVVVPSLLQIENSVLVFDPKRELHKFTGGFRASLGPCVVFDATSENSIKWNPLLEIRPRCEVRDAQNIAGILSDPSGLKNNKDLEIWDTLGAALLTASIIHVLMTAEDYDKNLGTVRDLLLDFENTCPVMMTTPHRLNPETGEPEVHPEVLRVARGLDASSARFRTSVVATATSYLTLFADPLVRANTATSSISAGDLVCGDKPVSIFYQVPPSDEDRVRPLTRLFFNQVARSLMEDEKFDPLKRPKHHRLTMVMEEFAQLGAVKFYERNLRQMRSYGINVLIIIQSFSDLLQLGPHPTILDNCHVVVAFASSDTQTLERLSTMTGTAVEYREGYSSADTSWGKKTISQHEQVRPLLQPGDVRQLGNDEQLILINGVKPIRAQLLKYYEIDHFTRRLLPAIPLDEVGFIPDSTAENPWFGERAKGPPVAVEQTVPVSEEEEADLLDNYIDLGSEPEGMVDNDRFAI